MKAWKAALAAAIATAAIALIVIAPMAQSSKSRGGLKVTSVTSGFQSNGQATAKCPRGYVAVGGGFFGSDPGVTTSIKLDERRWRVLVIGPNNKRGATADAQAVCAKGVGGFKIRDLGEAG